MTTWLQLPQNEPNNLEVVWCRTNRWSGAPFLAQYNAVTQVFTDQTNSLIYPVYAISYWRSQ